MAQAIPELRFAVFGGSGSGKTTLISSYYGSQQRKEFEETHKYKLNAENIGLGNLLLQNYYNLENGEFPQGSDQFMEYSFALKITGLQESCMRVKWFDYPGGWWEKEPEDEAEKSARLEAFKNLLQCHVGILLIDGVRFQKEGIKYVCYLFDQFKNVIDNILDNLAAAGEPQTDFPKQWILAMSKSDQLKQGTTAEDICKEILRGAAGNIKGVADVVSSDSFGHQYLLLSSVKGSDTKVENAHENIGLTLIAPIALVASLTQIVNNLPSGIAAQVLIQIIGKIKDVAGLLDKLDIFFPPQFKSIVTLLKLILSKDILDKTEEYFKNKLDEAIKNKDSIAAVTNLMNELIVSDEAKKVFFISQAPPNNK